MEGLGAAVVPPDADIHEAAAEVPRGAEHTPFIVRQDHPPVGQVPYLRQLRHVTKLLEESRRGARHAPTCARTDGNLSSAPPQRHRHPALDPAHQLVATQPVNGALRSDQASWAVCCRRIAPHSPTGPTHQRLSTTSQFTTPGGLGSARASRDDPLPAVRSTRSYWLALLNDQSQASPRRVPPGSAGPKRDPPNAKP